MSYDLEIWSVDSGPDVGKILPDLDQWRKEGDGWICEGQGWLIRIGGPEDVMDEDIPDEVRPHLPGIRFLFSLNLEPMGAPAAARKTLMQAAKAVALAAHGAIHDPQADSVTRPGGVKRFIPLKRDREVRVDLVSMGWWFTEGPLLQPDGAARFVGILERWLPEAMPRRYGLHEPPQHRLSETGRDHFVRFLSENLTGAVLYPEKPVGGIYISCDSKWGWQKNRGYRANRVTLEVDAGALDQPGWPDQLSRFWRKMSAFLKPFYGEVRTLTGHIPHGGTFASDMETELGPTSSWWWRGIPREPGYATVLGEPYTALWPRATDSAERSDGLTFLSLPKWERGHSIVEVVGKVPEEIAQKWTPKLTASQFGGKSVRWNTRYPPVFPFGDPPEDCLERE